MAYGIVRRMDNGWATTPNSGILMDMQTGIQYSFSRPDFTGTGKPPKWDVKVHDIVSFTLIEGVPTSVTRYKQYNKEIVHSYGT